MWYQFSGNDGSTYSSDLSSLGVPTTSISGSSSVSCSLLFSFLVGIIAVPSVPGSMTSHEYVPPKSSGYSFMVSDEEETGEHVDLDTDLVTGGVGSGLGGLMGEGRWVGVITDDFIGDGGASSMIMVPLLLL